MEKETVNNLVVVSDLHCGCRFGLCPPEGAVVDGGGRYMPSEFQRSVWALWEEFWSYWVPLWARGEPWDLVVNGDSMDNEHHRSTTQISQNMADQERLAEMVLLPVVTKARHYYHIRGTEAHAGPDGCDEERLARKLGAIPNKEGQHARWDLWKFIGPKQDTLIHCLHTIGTTGSQAYEATAIHKELVEAFAEAGRWGERPPDFIVRSHRHRYISDRVPTSLGHAESIITPGWQGKTSFLHRIAGARQSQPQFGGIMIRRGNEEHYHREKVWSLSRPEAEI